MQAALPKLKKKAQVDELEEGRSRNPAPSAGTQGSRDAPVQKEAGKHHRVFKE